MLVFLIFAGILTVLSVVAFVAEPDIKLSSIFACGACVLWLLFFLCWYNPTITTKEYRVHIVEDVPIILPAQEVQKFFNRPLKENDIIIIESKKYFGNHDLNSLSLKDGKDESK